MLKENQKIDWSGLSPEDRQNLVGFFDLLLQVDKRISPQDYKFNEENYAGYGNTDN